MASADQNNATTRVIVKAYSITTLSSKISIIQVTYMKPCLLIKTNLFWLEHATSKQLVFAGTKCIL
ncbi:hypothetical protein K492DRAFT_202457 [Lichtheimia hyalospora FSU 10163]|nr:hypothetical protein K492DRAFT_202457 [Lichtheimia hyalospora FSU 10163]